MSRRQRKLLRRSGKKHVKEASEAKEKVEEKKPERKLPFLDIYEKNYKTLLLIPFLMLVLAITVIGVSYVSTGEIIPKGVSLKGGITATIVTDADLDIGSIESSLRTQFPQGDVSVRALNKAGRRAGILVDASDIDQDTLVEALKGLTGGFDEYSVEEIGSSLGESFFRETILALLFAFLFMGLVVFFYFRTFVPSTAVILAAASDMIVTLAVVILLGVKISTAGIAAFLMLIGYSVDTDILLSTRVLKRKEGTVFDRVLGAMATGLTMNLTTLAALTVVLVLTQSDVLKQIMLILLIGLLADIINTWIQNAGILRWYMEGKE